MLWFGALEHESASGPIRLGVVTIRNSANHSVALIWDRLQVSLIRCVIRSFSFLIGIVYTRMYLTQSTIQPVAYVFTSYNRLDELLHLSSDYDKDILSFGHCENTVRCLAIKGHLLTEEIAKLVRCE